MYGGLYVFNSVYEKDLDASDANKRYRLVACGEVRYVTAVFLMILLLSISLLLGFYSYRNLFWFQFALIFINFLYTTVLKPRTWLGAISLISLTGPIRTIIGVLLAGGLIWKYWPFLLVHYLLSVCTHALKFYVFNKLELINFKRTFIICYYLALLISLQQYSQNNCQWLLLIILVFSVFFYRFFNNLKFKMKIVSEWMKD